MQNSQFLSLGLFLYAATVTAASQTTSQLTGSGCAAFGLLPDYCKKCIPNCSAAIAICAVTCSFRPSQCDVRPASTIPMGNSELMGRDCYRTVSKDPRPSVITAMNASIIVSTLGARMRLSALIATMPHFEARRWCSDTLWSLVFDWLRTGVSVL